MLLTNTRYESSLIRNWNEGTPVIPVFTADIVTNQTGVSFQQVNTRMEIPDLPHRRKPSAQQILDKIGYEGDIVLQIEILLTYVMSRPVPKDKSHILYSIKSTIQTLSLNHIFAKELCFDLSVYI